MKQALSTLHHCSKTSVAGLLGSVIALSALHVSECRADQMALECGQNETPQECIVRANTLMHQALEAMHEQSKGCPEAKGSNPPSDSILNRIALFGQSTAVFQGHGAFKSPYQGQQSLNGNAEGAETTDLTAYGGFRLWKGAEAWFNTEIDQGYGLSNTFGVAGFTSGEAYKVGSTTPYLKLPRLYLRQTINLGGEKTHLDSAPNQMSGDQTNDRFVFTVGKFAVTDVFDNNKYAHDPRHDFLNWSIIDAGAFDYAANSWGFTVGGSAELYKGNWVFRAGAFAMSTVPNSPDIDLSGNQRQLVGEVERDYKIAGQPGKVRVLAYDTHANMGTYADAVALSQATGQPATMAPVRKMQDKPGASIDVEQDIGENAGVFARASKSDGKVEAFDFTDINLSLSAGLSLSGKLWGRQDDAFGLGVVANQISKEGAAYLNAGGMGLVVGDGKLPHPGTEGIAEAYYSLGVLDKLHFTYDVQLVNNPGYNTDRGPVAVFGIRAHGEW